VPAPLPVLYLPRSNIGGVARPSAGKTVSFADLSSIQALTRLLRFSTDARAMPVNARPVRRPARSPKTSQARLWGRAGLRESESKKLFASASGGWS